MFHFIDYIRFVLFFKNLIWFPNWRFINKPRHLNVGWVDWGGKTEPVRATKEGTKGTGRAIR